MIFLILAAAGTGSRLQSSLPKQFLDVAGKPVFLHSLLRVSQLFSSVAVMVPQGWEDRVDTLVTQSRLEHVRVFTGGKNRQESVWLGLQQAPPETSLVLVHDAARPLAGLSLFERTIEGAREWGACIPVMPVAETVKEVDNGRVLGTLDRARLRLVQTPQGFHRSVLEKAMRAARETGFQGTDEASLIERIGSPVHVIEGERRNFKITWAEDLELAAYWLAKDFDLI